MVFLLVWAATSEGFGLDDLDELPGGILSEPASFNGHRGLQLRVATSNSRRAMLVSCEHQEWR